MVRCGCASDQCACNIVAGENVRITGTGSKNNPFVVSAATVVVDESGDVVTPPSSGRLTGEIIAYGGAAAPEGWILCNGQAVNRAVYAALFAVIGTNYGAGDGGATFNVPDLVGRFPMGETGSAPRGTEGGANSRTIAAANLPPHKHAIDHDHAAFDTASGGSHTHSAPTARSQTDGSSNTVYREASTTGSAALTASGAHTHNINVPAYTGNSGDGPGASTPLDTTPAFASVIYIIKA